MISSGFRQKLSDKNCLDQAVERIMCSFFQSYTHSIRKDAGTTSPQIKSSSAKDATNEKRVYAMQRNGKSDKMPEYCIWTDAILLLVSFQLLFCSLFFPFIYSVLIEMSGNWSWNECWQWLWSNFFLISIGFWGGVSNANNNNNKYTWNVRAQNTNAKSVYPICVVVCNLIIMNLLLCLFICNFVVDITLIINTVRICLPLWLKFQWFPFFSLHRQCILVNKTFNN